MVLEELGGKISAALRNLSGGDAIDKAAFDAALKEISNALVQSDVEVSLVMQLRKNITKKVNIAELGAGIDKRAVIEKAVRDELCALLDGSGETSVPKPKRGKPYVAMFVGLQVRCPAPCLPCHVTHSVLFHCCTRCSLHSIVRRKHNHVSESTNYLEQPYCGYARLSAEHDARKHWCMWHMSLVSYSVALRAG